MSLFKLIFGFAVVFCIYKAYKAATKDKGIEERQETLESLDTRDEELTLDKRIKKKHAKLAKKEEAIHGDKDKDK